MFDCFFDTLKTRCLVEGIQKRKTTIQSNYYANYSMWLEKKFIG